jgi:ATP-dependent exoDNAse (exonuclease V) beta subunit
MKGFQILNKDFTVELDKLDQSQEAAVISDAPEIVIRASAGSGKTHTLITAVAQYRYDHVNDRICAITFTRAARAEMKARLEDLGIRDVEVTTIHVWARNMLDYFADKYDIKIRVLEEKEIKAILEEIVREYIIRSRIRSVNIGVLYTYITGSKTMDITDNYRRTLNALEERYIKYKKDNGLYDFTDYPQYLWDVMTAYDEYINNIDALFVDEFQDVDTTQFNIFERVNANKKFYIGDPWQSIYIFRSADGEVFNKLDNFELFKLKYNYRSYQEIIDYATTVYNKISKRLEYMSSSYITMVTDSDPCKVMCSRDYGGKVSVIDHDGDCYQFTNGICDYDVSMYQALNDIFDGEEPMILCRTNKQVRALQDLGVTNVSTVHQAKGLEYDKVVVVDMEIEEFEDLNVAYVALTRARDELLVINFGYLENYLKNKGNSSYWR